jgi:hypothetical protein
LDPAGSKQGIRHEVRQMGVIKRNLVAWMEEHEYESVAQLKGRLSRKKCPEPSAFERAHSMKAISQFVIAKWILSSMLLHHLLPSGPDWAPANGLCDSQPNQSLV